MYSVMCYLNHECENKTVSRKNNEKKAVVYFGSPPSELLPVGTEPSPVSKQTRHREQED